MSGAELDPLLGCPCCGYEAVLETSTTEDPRIDCMCGISMTGITEAVLRVKWNMRSSTTAKKIDAPLMIHNLENRLAAAFKSKDYRDRTVVDIPTHHLHELLQIVQGKVRIVSIPMVDEMIDAYCQTAPELGEPHDTYYRRRMKAALDVAGIEIRP